MIRFTMYPLKDIIYTPCIILLEIYYILINFKVFDAFINLVLVEFFFTFSLNIKPKNIGLSVFLLVIKNLN